MLAASLALNAALALGIYAETDWQRFAAVAGPLFLLGLYFALDARRAQRLIERRAR
jgi:hypothetical protein